MDKNRITELNDEELDQVAGGAAYINANTNMVVFSTLKKVYSFKNCTYRDVRNLCEELIGQCGSESEFDNACIEALKEKGWI